MVPSGHRADDSGRPHHVHVQGDAVQPPRLQLPAAGQLRGRPPLDLRAAPHAEVQAGAAQPRRHGVPRAALDVRVAAAVHYHV